MSDIAASRPWERTWTERIATGFFYGITGAGLTGADGGGCRVAIPGRSGSCSVRGVRAAPERSPSVSRLAHTVAKPLKSCQTFTAIGDVDANV
ncbi:MAG: hypothetical protein AAF414_03260 [Pseudomonadota bacterium]